jgi:3-isopropylmalate/(R)-2-methylmalate dehydratase small subunit
MSKLGSPIIGQVWLFGDSISTNQIGGGGRGQRGMAAAERLAMLKANCLTSVRPEFSQEVHEGDILVAGTNFGNGSSSPGAVEALIACGIGALVADSISRLLMRTCIAKGLPAFAVPGISEIVIDGGELVVDYQNSVARNPSTGATVSLRRFPPTVEQIYEAGGIQDVIARRLEAEGIRPKNAVATPTS